jgi:hypothetical protein
MNVGLIGARRTSNGIGEYIGKYFHMLGADVSAVLGTTAQSSTLAAQNLSKYGIAARAYSDFSSMVDSEELDAIVIASPTHTHLDYMIECIEAGAHVFCEKPFVWPGHNDLERVIDDIFTRAHKRGIIIAINSQWPFCLQYYENLCGNIVRKSEETFFMRLSPVCSGEEMVPDSLPHALSMLFHILGEGAIRDLAIMKGKDIMDISFCYITGQTSCRTQVSLVREEAQPRTFSFGFGGRVAHRIIDMDTYAISFDYEGKKITVPDPLELSVRDFISAVEDERLPSIGKEHVVSTSRLLKHVYDFCTVQ